MVKTRKAIQEEEVATYAAVTRMTRSKKGGAGQGGESLEKKSPGKVLSWSMNQIFSCYLELMSEVSTRNFLAENPHFYRFLPEIKKMCIFDEESLKVARMRTS